VHASPGPADRYTAAYTDLLTAMLTPAVPTDDARDVAEVLIALTKGLELDTTDPDRPYRLLSQGVDLITAALPASTEENL
jgi:TetR/AcrR family transcriptional regulator